MRCQLRHTDFETGNAFLRLEVFAKIQRRTNLQKCVRPIWSFYRRNLKDTGSAFFLTKILLRRFFGFENLFAI
jgi:hypothetical protein